MACVELALTRREDEASRQECVFLTRPVSGAMEGAHAQQPPPDGGARLDRPLWQCVPEQDPKAGVLAHEPPDPREGRGFAAILDRGFPID
jgi:hypothetical protein